MHGKQSAKCAHIEALANITYFPCLSETQQIDDDDITRIDDKSSNQLTNQSMQCQIMSP